MAKQSLSRWSNTPNVQMLTSSIPLDLMAATIENAPTAILIAQGQHLVLANPAAVELFEVSSLTELCAHEEALLCSEEDKNPLALLLAAWSAPTWKRSSCQVCANIGDHAQKIVLDLTAWRISFDGRPAVHMELRALSPQGQRAADQETELAWVMEMTSQVAWTADPQGNITNFSSRWLELTGLTKRKPWVPDG